eukprot:6176003-Pleurochrysis_carterae.AAC.1
MQLRRTAQCNSGRTNLPFTNTASYIYAYGELYRRPFRAPRAALNSISRSYEPKTATNNSPITHLWQPN